jgi:hypothetical protein
MDFYYLAVLSGYSSKFLRRSGMKNIILFLLCFTLFGCSTFGTVARTNDLSPGMTITEVKGVLGRPSQTQFVADKLVLKYNLHQYWKGWVPYYVVFNKDTMKLEGWFADEQEYYRNQQLWIESMPQQVDVNVRERMDVQRSVF